MLALPYQLIRQFFYVVYLCHRNKGKTAQMTVCQHGLGICVAYHAYARTARELVQLALKTWTEIRVFKIMDFTLKMAFVIHRRNTAAARAKMELVVCTVEYVRNAILL